MGKLLTEEEFLSWKLQLSGPQPKVSPQAPNRKQLKPYRSLSLSPLSNCQWESQSRSSSFSFSSMELSTQAPSPPAISPATTPSFPASSYLALLPLSSVPGPSSTVLTLLSISTLSIWFGSTPPRHASSCSFHFRLWFVFSNCDFSVLYWFQFSAISCFPFHKLRLNTYKCMPLCMCMYAYVHVHHSRSFSIFTVLITQKISWKWNFLS